MYAFVVEVVMHRNRRGGIFWDKGGYYGIVEGYYGLRTGSYRLGEGSCERLKDEGRRKRGFDMSDLRFEMRSGRVRTEMRTVNEQERIRRQSGTDNVARRSRY